MERVYLSNYFCKKIKKVKRFKRLSVPQKKKIILEEQTKKRTFNTKTYNVIIDGKIVNEYKMFFWSEDENFKTEYCRLMYLFDSERKPYAIFVKDDVFLIFNSGDSGYFALYWKDQIKHFNADFGDFLFSNEKYLFISEDYEGFFGNIEIKTTIIDIDTLETVYSGRDKYFGYLFLRDQKGIFVFRDVLEYELKKHFEYFIPDFSLMTTFSKIEKQDDTEMEIELINKKVFLPKSFITKINSKIINEMLEEGKVYLPFTEFKKDLRTLDYLMSDYILIKMVKELIKMHTRF